MAALYGLGMMLASVFLAAGREAWHISHLLQEPIYLASGVYFPVKALGSLIATLVSIIPLTLGLDAMRQLLFHSDPPVGFLPVGIELTLLIGLAVLFLVFALITLTILVKGRRRGGRPLAPPRPSFLCPFFCPPP